MFEAINDLKDRERQILILRFGLENGEEMTQKDVADFLGISQSYISRLEKRIIKKLQTKLNKK
jgi:RNA polymerase sporulation-specific sigma factor